MRFIESAKSKKRKKRKKNKNKEFIVQYWSLLEPKPYAELMVAQDQLKDFYKQSSKLQEVKFKGELKRDESDGYVYVKVKDDIVHGLFPLIDKEDGAQKPPYFGKGKTGAHISAISSEEAEELKDVEIKEIGQDVEFELKNIYKTNPEGWDEMDMVWFVTVDAPELPKMRKRYGLPATYDGKGHDFHCTIGVREKK